jgi:hypothetical protein
MRRFADREALDKAALLRGSEQGPATMAAVVNPFPARGPSPVEHEPEEPMTRNVGTGDRLARALAALGMLACAVAAPLPVGLRLAAFAAPALYLLFTAVSSTCLGYRLMGRSTCPVPRR